MDKKEIIIVDDHLLFARSLENLINTFDGYQVRFTLNNGSELVDRVSSGMSLPDIILLDVNMPIMGGVATMKWLKKFKPEAKVLALSMEDDEKTILTMLRYGAKGYMLKDIQPKLLNEALDAVIEKGYYYTEKVSKTLMHAIDIDDDEEDKVVLRDRLLQFLKLICEEKTHSEIAEEMCLSPKTIDGYRQELFTKLGVKNRVGLVMYAIKNKIVEL